MSLRDHLLSQGWPDADDIVAEVERCQRAAPLLASWTLPFPPSVNAYWRNIVIKGQARTLISSRGRDYTENVAKLLLGKKAIPHGVALSVHIRLYPPTRRVMDIDNSAKATLDSIVKAKMIRDDSDIWDLRLTRECLSSPPGRIVVEVRQAILAGEVPRLDFEDAPPAVAAQAEQFASMRQRLEAPE